MKGQVISLDRGYPLVRTGAVEVRAQHAIELVKNSSKRAVVGDYVRLVTEPDQDTPFITSIEERSSVLFRRELVQSIHEGEGKANEQILAANFDFIAIIQSLGKRRLDTDYLERQLVMAYESGAETIIILTKKDMARYLLEDCAAVEEVAPKSTVLCREKTDPLDELKAYFSPHRIGVLLGRSGVGKSTLVNLLLGEQRQITGSVRKKDNAGRHITVARKLMELPSGGAVIDTPGMRSIGVLGAEQGLARTFHEITAEAAGCQYRNCTHTHEPGCAVIAAVEAKVISKRRLKSYRTLAAEVYD